MKTSRFHSTLGIGLLLIGSIAPSAFASNSSAKNARAARPADAPGWIVIEDDFYYPMVLEPAGWFDSIQANIRKSDEKAAASELRMAESWLDVAASHALPITRDTLKTAATSLGSLAGDLEAGKTVEAVKMKSALEKSSKALAEWHYFNAEKNLANQEEQDATRDLQAASRYLKWAADSASYQYGDEFATVYDDLYGWTVTDAIPNNMTSNLKTVKTELDKLSDTLNKEAK